jgi:hypothetical protein
MTNQSANIAIPPAIIPDPPAGSGVRQRVFGDGQANMAAPSAIMTVPPVNFHGRQRDRPRRAPNFQIRQANIPVPAAFIAFPSQLFPSPPANRPSRTALFGSESYFMAVQANGLGIQTAMTTPLWSRLAMKWAKMH